MPEWVTDRLYQIIDIINGINETTKEEKLFLDNLLVYHKYNLTISLTIKHNGETFEGTPALFEFETDVGRPGTVRELTVTPGATAGVFLIKWISPAANESNGPINHYYLRVLNETGDPIKEK